MAKEPAAERISRERIERKEDIVPTITPPEITAPEPDLTEPPSVPDIVAETVAATQTQVQATRQDIKTGMRGPRATGVLLLNTRRKLPSLLGNL